MGGPRQMEQHCQVKSGSQRPSGTDKRMKAGKSRFTGPCCDDVTGFMHAEAKRYRGATNRN